MPRKGETCYDMLVRLLGNATGLGALFSTDPAGFTTTGAHPSMTEYNTFLQAAFDALANYCPSRGMQRLVGQVEDVLCLEDRAC